MNKQTQRERFTRVPRDLFDDECMRVPTHCPICGDRITVNAPEVAEPCCSLRCYREFDQLRALYLTDVDKIEATPYEFHPMIDPSAERNGRAL